MVRDAQDEAVGGEREGQPDGVAPIQLWAHGVYRTMAAPRPGHRHPIAQRAREAGVEIIGDIELFARARPELPWRQRDPTPRPR